MAREIAKTEAYKTSRCQRKKAEMLFAHLKRILKLDRLRLRGPNGARDEFHLAATRPKPPQARQADTGTSADGSDLSRRGARRRGLNHRSAPLRLLQTTLLQHRVMVGGSSAEEPPT